MNIRVEADVKGATKYLGYLQKQVPFATSKALNETAAKVRDMEMLEIVRKIDRPTPQTVEAYRIERANKRRLVAAVELKRNNKYLTNLITGGSESNKHQVIGKRAKADAFGNLPRTATKAAKTFSKTIKGQSGVWKRTGGKRNPKVHLVAHFPSSRKYSKRLDFYGVGERTTKLYFPQFMRKAMAYAIRTAR